MKRVVDCGSGRVGAPLTARPMRELRGAASFPSGRGTLPSFAEINSAVPTDECASAMGEIEVTITPKCTRLMKNDCALGGSSGAVDSIAGRGQQLDAHYEQQECDIDDQKYYRHCIGGLIPTPESSVRKIA